ncbi:unnamed protein product [Protopolystoma xenopodis]|uniref:Uncharacterized protein n=1 Tax=Protopolystoma xenopodis TaxID=117903 RepID=A0A448XIZ0_9PLAT|nr:unnamed protein product [Protopolystoma xenopodis]
MHSPPGSCCQQASPSNLHVSSCIEDSLSRPQGSPMPLSPLPSTNFHTAFDPLLSSPSDHVEVEMEATTSAEAIYTTVEALAEAAGFSAPIYNAADACVDSESPPKSTSLCFPLPLALPDVDAFANKSGSLPFHHAHIMPSDHQSRSDASFGSSFVEKIEAKPLLMTTGQLESIDISRTGLDTSDDIKVCPSNTSDNSGSADLSAEVVDTIASSREEMEQLSTYAQIDHESPPPHALSSLVALEKNFCAENELKLSTRLDSSSEPNSEVSLH